MNDIEPHYEYRVREDEMSDGSKRLRPQFANVNGTYIWFDLLHVNSDRKVDMKEARRMLEEHAAKEKARAKVVSTTMHKFPTDR